MNESYSGVVVIRRTSCRRGSFGRRVDYDEFLSITSCSLEVAVTIFNLLSAQT